MNSKRLNYLLIGLLVLLTAGLVIVAREANMLLENKSKTLVSLKASDLTTSSQQAQLSTDKKEIAKYSDLNTIAKSVVPQDKDQAEAVQEIVNLAADSGIGQLSSITFPPSTLGTTTSVKTPGGLTQVTAVKGISGVYDLQITITQGTDSEVPYSDFTMFLAKLEQNRRTAQVSSITVQPDQKNPSIVSFTLILDEFIKP